MLNFDEGKNLVRTLTYFRTSTGDSGAGEVVDLILSLEPSVVLVWEDKFCQEDTEVHAMLGSQN